MRLKLFLAMVILAGIFFASTAGGAIPTAAQSSGALKPVIPASVQDNSQPPGQQDRVVQQGGSTSTPTASATRTATLTRTPSRTPTASATPPMPTRTSGGLTFGPASVVDFQRTEGEPINHIDKDGNYWESGPWGFSTNQSFIHRSTDNGDQFNLVSPIELRPNSPPGGGDTDIVTDDQGYAYFTDLEGAFDEVDCSVSNDGGNTWRKNPACIGASGLDRQWFAIDNGTTAAASDNTIFVTSRQVPTTLSYIYSSPGSTGPSDMVGGLVYTSTTGTTALPVGVGGSCGQMKFDPVNRMLYLPCQSGSSQVIIAKAHVNPGQRTGLTFTTTTVSSSSSTGNIFSNIAIDQAGNLYALWVNTSNNNVYYAYSTNPTAATPTWSPAIQVNSAPSNTNIFPWIAAGSSGRIVVAWYGTAQSGNPSNFPRWFNGAQGRIDATNYKWYGYVALITNAASFNPTIDQSQFTEKPMHYGQYCLAGTTCSADPTSDRTMADFMAVNFDKDGRIRLVYDDTTSQHHGAHLFETRQLAGATAFTGITFADSPPSNPISDPTGDAHYPHYAPSPAAPGPNQANLDFTQVSVNQLNANRLVVRMTVNSLNSFTMTGKSRAFWLTRFQAKSIGQAGEEAYRIFYVGAESTNGAAPVFFSGSGEASDPTTKAPGNGCLTTSPQNCKVVQYPFEYSVSGFISGNTLCAEVSLPDGFGVNRPIYPDDILYNVTAFSGGRNNDTDLYADVDSTRSFDLPLGTYSGVSCTGQQAPTATVTNTPTNTLSPTPNTFTPTATSTRTATATRTGTANPTTTATGSVTAIRTATRTHTPSPTATAATGTATASPTTSPSATITPTGTATASPTTSPSATITPTGTLTSVIEQYDSHVQYDGWRGILSSQSSGGTYRMSRVKDNYAKFRFSDDRIIWLTVLGPNQGIARVTIDGQDKGTVNLYQATRQYRKRFVFGNLGNGTHYIVITVTGDKDPNSSDTNVAVDGFISHDITTEDNTSRIRFDSWKGKENVNATANTYVQTGKKGAIAQLKFTGDRIQFITARGPNYGNVEIVIKSASSAEGGTFDLYSPNQEWQYPIEFSNLGGGTHTIEVSPLGTKNPNSKGKAVVVDAFRGPITTAAPSRNPDEDVDTTALESPLPGEPDTSQGIAAVNDDWWSQLTAFLFGN